MPLSDLLVDLPPRHASRNGAKSVGDGSKWLIEIHPDPILITHDGRIAYANPSAVEMFGAESANEIVGRSLIDFSSADQYDVLERFLAETDEHAEIRPLRHEIVQLTGDWRIVETFAKEVNHRGKPATLVVLRDVTERRRSRDGSHALTKAIAEGICRIDLSARVRISEDPAVQVRKIMEHARVQRTNDQMAVVLGLSDRDLLQNRPLRSILKDDAPVRAFVHSGYRLKNHEIAFTLPGGVCRYVMLSAVGIIEDGEIGHIWGSCIDVTERVELERRMVDLLEKQQQEIGRELHDGIGQLLTGVSILGDVLCRRLSEDHDAFPIARSLVQYASDAASQIRTIYRGLTPVQIEREHLVCLLDELVANTGKIPKVTCRFNHDGRTDVASDDVKLHLYRIAQEAINNALKHANADNIVVTLKSCDEDIVLSIEDDGLGMNGNGKRQGGRSHGMDSMHYRANAIYGTLEVGPTQDRGTRVSCRVSRVAAGVDAA